jgi:Spy/CpxP family protein refolding chaperone
MKFELRGAARALALLSLLVGFAAGAQEQISDNMDILREKVAADKKLIIAENLILTESQAAQFWPIYEAYQKDLAALNERIGALIENYASAYNAGNVQEAKANELVDEFLAIEKAQLDLKQKYAERLDGVIPAVERARYLQMENKIRALIDYDLAANIPLVD